MNARIAVIGASGFVGASLVERLLARKRDVVPFIHSTGNAWRLARHGVPLEMMNLLDADQLGSALRGFTHVVNCSRGGDDVMFKGLRNLVAACKANSVQRFVHLSSVMVYGDPPAPDSVSEDGRTAPERGTYGWIKLEQDKLVQKAAAEGLPCSVLCPPNISGAYSLYVATILNSLRRGELALLDGGRTPCNVVDVENLCHAIELAFDHGPTDGQRLFITDDHPTTWLDIVNALQPLSPQSVEIPAITRQELDSLRENATPEASRSFKRSLLHLVSSDVRQALRKDPLWAKVDQTFREGVRALGSSIEDRVRLSVEGPTRVEQARRKSAVNARLCVQQLRGVTHRCDRAKALLGYKPLHTFEESMRAFGQWYRTSYGWDSPAAALLQAM